MDFYLQNKPPSEGAPRRREKGSGYGAAQRSKHQSGMQKAATFTGLPSPGTLRWLASRHSSHCSHLCIVSESQANHSMVVSTFTLCPLEMWLFHHSCPQETDSPKSAPLLSEGFHFFFLLISPLSLPPLKTTLALWPVELSADTEMSLPCLA